MNSRVPRSRRSLQPPVRILLAPLLLLLVACGSSSEREKGGADAETVSKNQGSDGPLRPEESRVLGVFPDPIANFAQAVVAPDSVMAGERFVVTITTTGSGCERVGDVGVLLGERDATVMVYDFTSANRPDIVCTMELKALKHEVPLTFSKPGPAVIRLWGRKQGSNSPPYGEPDVIEHRIVVR
jgi:hypothetical protein